MNSDHHIEIKQTKDDWHYAQCSCGWRSLADPPHRRDVAELRGSVHVESRT